MTSLHLAGLVHALQKLNAALPPRATLSAATSAWQRESPCGPAVGTGLLARPNFRAQQGGALLVSPSMYDARDSRNAHSQLSETLCNAKAFFPEERGDTQGLPAVRLSLGLLVIQSALSALQMVSVGLYLHSLINPLSSLILQSRNTSPPDSLLLLVLPQHPWERGDGGGGHGRSASTRSSELAAGDFPAGTPGFLFALPAAHCQPTGFRHSLIRTFLVGSASPGAEVASFLHQLRDLSD